MKKKVVSVLLCLTLCFSLIACSSGKSGKEKTEEKEKKEETVKVAFSIPEMHSFPESWQP